MGKELSRPAVVSKERDFRLRHGYAETRWRGMQGEGGKLRAEGRVRKLWKGAQRCASTSRYLL